MGLVGKLGSILAREDAEQEGRNRCAGYRQGRQGDQERVARGVPRREGRHRSLRRSARCRLPWSSLSENLNALVDALVKAKPSSAKGRYLQKITVSSTMGPGVDIDTIRGPASGRQSSNQV